MCANIILQHEHLPFLLGTAVQILTVVKSKHQTLWTTCITDALSVKSFENPIPVKMRFLFPHALFHFPSQSLGIDLIQSYLFLLQPSCHELTSMVDQVDYNMSGHVASPIKTRITAAEAEYIRFNLSIHFFRPQCFQVQLCTHCVSSAIIRYQVNVGDHSLKYQLVDFLTCEPFKKQQCLLVILSQFAANSPFIILIIQRITHFN